MKPPEKKWPPNVAGNQPARPTTHAGKFKPPVAHAKSAAGVPNVRRPGLPPAHKPQTRPPVAQTKTAAPPRPAMPRPAPPAARPRHAPQVMQTKAAAVNRPGNTQGGALNARPPAQAATRSQVAQRKTAREAMPRTGQLGRGTAPPPSRPAPRVPAAQEGRAGVVQRMLGVASEETVGSVSFMFAQAEQEIADRASGLVKLQTLVEAKRWNSKRRKCIDKMACNSVPLDYNKVGANIVMVVGWYPDFTYRHPYNNYQNCLPGGTYNEYGPSAGAAKEKRSLTSDAGGRVRPKATIDFWVTDGGTHQYTNAKAAAKPWFKWDSAGARWWKWDARSNRRHAVEYAELVMSPEVLLSKAEGKAVRDGGTHVPDSHIA